MRSKKQTDYAKYLISEYGVFLSVDDLAKLFNYASGEAVRKAHHAGRLPVKLRTFQDRRGFYVTAFEVAEVVRKFDHINPQEEESTCINGN